MAAEKERARRVATRLLARGWLPSPLDRRLLIPRQSRRRPVPTNEIVWLTMRELLACRHR